MQDILKVILDIQEFDIKMIRLMKLKKARQKELQEIDSLKSDLQEKIRVKEEEIQEIKDRVSSHEEAIASVKEKIKHFESQQDLVKKIEEFNALNQEVSHADRERSNLEQKLNVAADELMAEEEVLTNLQETFQSTEENSKALEEEIHANIAEINKEGQTLLEQREALVKNADEPVMKIYQRLINNKKDRVVVPITNRCCSGCHITLTAQQENLVRKGERLNFCEHCSRILYWVDQVEEPTEQASPRRRRKKVTSN